MLMVVNFFIEPGKLIRPDFLFMVINSLPYTILFFSILQR